MDQKSPFSDIINVLEQFAPVFSDGVWQPSVLTIALSGVIDFTSPTALRQHFA